MNLENLWLWTEVGEGYFYKVSYIRADGWVVCGVGLDQTSWCGTDTLYRFPDERKAEMEEIFRAVLRAKREAWNRRRTGRDEPFPSIPLYPQECRVIA